jgi:outer membrane biosynthesis protein TonB
MPAEPVQMSEISAGRGSMSLSFVASLVAHGALLLAVAVPSVRDRLIQPDPGESAPLQAQTWAGTTAELPSGETLYDVQLTGSQGVGTVPEPPAPPQAPAPPPADPAEPAPPPPAKTSPKTTPPTPPPSPKPDEPARPAPKPESPTKPEPKAAPPKPAEDDDPYADVSLPKEKPAKPAKEPVAAKPAKSPAVAANPKPAPASGADATEPPASDPAKTSGLGGTGTSGGSFGAVGRAGVRDLGAAFTQAIPAASGADATWSEIALGDGGTIRIALDIDENGRLKTFTVLEKDPPKQLRNLAKRTFDVLQFGTFALRSGAVTAGRQTVEVSASVRMSDKPATSGGLIELSHAFQDGVGRAHFVQSTGREVRLRVRVIRIEVTGAPEGGGGG